MTPGVGLITTKSLAITGDYDLFTYGADDAPGGIGEGETVGN